MLKKTGCYKEKKKAEKSIKTDRIKHFSINTFHTNRLLLFVKITKVNKN